MKDNQRLGEVDVREPVIVPSPADPAASAGNGSAGPIPPLLVTDPITLQDEPVPDRQWLIPGWAPMQYVVAFYGATTTGKSLLAQMLMTSSALTKSWLGLSVRPVKVLGMFCEDSVDELHIRQAAINRHHGADFADLENVRWLCRFGLDNVLCEFNERGRIVLTPLYFQLRHEALSFGAQLVVIDTAADTFGGNENVRAQVREFISTALGAIAREIDGVVLLCAHPSRAGMASGDGYSGSTAWEATVRSVWNLTRPKSEDGEPVDDGVRILTRGASNYAGGTGRVEMRWKDGVFVGDGNSPLIESSERGNAEKAFVEMLDRLTEQGREVSPSPSSANFAPKVMMNMPEHGRLKRRDLERAMESLFSTDVIKVEIYGPPSRKQRRILRAKIGQDGGSPDGQ